MTDELDVVRRLRPAGAPDPAARAAARVRVQEAWSAPGPIRAPRRRRRLTAALVPTVALALGVAVLAGVRPGGDGTPAPSTLTRPHDGAAEDVPAGGLAPGTAWYVRRLVEEPLSGGSPAAGRDWHATLPVQSETWVTPDGHVTAREVVRAPARFASEDDRLAYLASGSTDADLSAGTVLVDGPASAGGGALEFLGPKADVGHLPARLSAAALLRLVKLATPSPPPASTPSSFHYDRSADRLGGVADLLTIAPLPQTYRRALVDSYATSIHGVRSRRDGDVRTLTLGDAHVRLDADTMQLRSVDGLGSTAHVEAQSVVGRVGEHPSRGVRGP